MYFEKASQLNNSFSHYNLRVFMNMDLVLHKIVSKIFNTMNCQPKIILHWVLSRWELVIWMDKLSIKIIQKYWIVSNWQTDKIVVIAFNGKTAIYNSVHYISIWDCWDFIKIFKNQS